MKTANSSVPRAGVGFAGLILLSVAVGTGAASADTFEHGGSTATVEQSGGGKSRSEVTRYKDGQKIVTQDGSSTDVTIQGGTDSPAPDYGWGRSEWGDGRFDRQGFQERFSRGGADDSEPSSSSQREAFKQMMLERMRSPFWR